MSRRRRTYRALTDSRIYRRGNKFSLFYATPLVHPVTRKASKWHVLCPIAEGERKARRLADEIIDFNLLSPEEGDLPVKMRLYTAAVIAKRDKNKPSDPVRVKMHEAGNAEIRRISDKIIESFRTFRVADVLPVEIADFVDQWEGQRMAQIYLYRLSDFFAWCNRRGLRHDNPCTNIKVDKPQKRKVLISDEQFHAIRDALLVSKDKKRTPSGPMMQCYVDLCYLIFQRTTEIRLLRRNQTAGDAIQFTPTKTERSSGASVAVPITPAIREVLDRASKCYPVSSVYVIHTADGQPFTASGLRSAWDRAAERAGVAGVTLKDLRAKAITDAKRAGWKTSQLAVAAAHTDEGTTEGYIRDRDTPVSEVTMSLPKRPQKAA